MTDAQRPKSADIRDRVAAGILTKRTVFAETDDGTMWLVLSLIDIDTILVDGNPDGGYRRPPRQLPLASIVNVETLA